jgi:uracil-DNA glycosylase
LAVLAAPLAGEARQMFERMLLHVLAMEPRDVFLLDPVACATCAAQLRLQLETVAPRAVLAMGEAARALTQGQVGAWGSFAGAPCLATLHPEELLADPGAKRAAFEHLKELARRVRA